MFTQNNKNKTSNRSSAVFLYDRKSNMNIDANPVIIDHDANTAQVLHPLPTKKAPVIAFSNLFNGKSSGSTCAEQQ